MWLLLGCGKSGLLMIIGGQWASFGITGSGLLNIPHSGVEAVSERAGGGPPASVGSGMVLPTTRRRGMALAFALAAAASALRLF